MHTWRYVIIIGQPRCPVVGRMSKHAACKLACHALSSARSCPSSICPGRLSTGWLVSLVLSCRMVTRDVHRSVDVPCSGPTHSSHIAAYIYAFCPLPDPEVGLSVCECDVGHISFHLGMCGRTFVLCLFGE